MNFDNTEINIDIQNLNFGNTEINIDIQTWISVIPKLISKLIPILIIQNMNYVNTEINIDIHFNFSSQPWLKNWKSCSVLTEL